MPIQRSVAVLTGGDGPERAGSLVSGTAVADALTRLGSTVTVRDIADPTALAGIRDHDLAYVATHGWTGEDGKLQGLLEVAQVPYTGSGVLASAIAMHKPTANIMFAQAGLNVPTWRSVARSLAQLKDVGKWAANRGFPLFAKPASGGGSLGSRLITSEDELDALVDELAAEPGGDEFLFSDVISGHELSVGLLWCRGRLEVLPILGTTHDAAFYNYMVKHDTSLRRHTCPADLDSATARTVRDHAVTAFFALRCHGVARIDFIVDDNGVPWVLEVNTVPGMSRQGNLATMAEADGIDYNELVMSIASTAFSKLRRQYRP